MLDFVVPGEGLLTTSLIKKSLTECLDEHDGQKSIKLGPGLVRSDDQFHPLYAGFVNSIGGNKFWLEHRQKKYAPVANDYVIGIVKSVHSDHYRVDIGYHQSAILDSLAFEGASKRNRPQLNIGSIVYARIVLANRDIEPEISCTMESGKSGPFGQLASSGHVMKLDSLLAKNLLFDPNPPLLKAIDGEKISFDMAVGINGLIWVLGATIEQTHFLVSLLRLVQTKIKHWNVDTNILDPILKDCINQAKNTTH